LVWSLGLFALVSLISQPFQEKLIKLNKTQLKQIQNSFHSGIGKVMIELARFPVQDILPRIGLNFPRIQLAGHSVKAGSHRLECLKRSQKCVSCRRVGTLFVLEVQIQSPAKGINCFIDNCQLCIMNPRNVTVATPRPHLNLYHIGKYNQLVLMTQDHIMPKCAGGSNEMENLQTMCRQCNARKGANIPKELR